MGATEESLQQSMGIPPECVAEINHHSFEDVTRVVVANAVISQRGEHFGDDVEYAIRTFPDLVGYLAEVGKPEADPLEQARVARFLGTLVDTFIRAGHGE